MKLIHITATHLNPDGGVPVVLKNLVTEQNKIKEFTAKVISVSSPVDKMDSEFFEFVETEKLNQYLENFKPDFAILHSFYYIEYNKVIKILKEKNIRYFIEPHGSFGRAAMKKSMIKKYIANNTIFKKQIKNAYGFIFLNEAELKDSIYTTQNDIVIPNGIFPKKYNIEKKDEITDNKLYFIGRYDINHKGLDYLFDGLDILEKEKYEVTINMWGGGNAKNLAYMKNKIENYKTVKVNINSSIYNEEKDKVLEQYCPMILTSRYEGFPMTILEALLYGNPCIVTPGTNVSKEIMENNIGWVVELDSNSIANGIKKAIEDYHNNKDEYIKKCKQYVTQNYAWNVIAEDSLAKLKEKL